MICARRAAKGPTIPYAMNTPRNVPTRALPISAPKMAGGWSIAAIVFTTPRTHATMPSAGNAPSRLASAVAGFIAE